MTLPKTLRFNRSEKQLFIEFKNQPTKKVSFETLRVNSPSAEVQGHGGQKPPPPIGKENVGVLSAEYVGHYAVRIKFDDGHESGLFTWDYLNGLSA